MKQSHKILHWFLAFCGFLYIPTGIVLVVLLEHLLLPGEKIGWIIFGFPVGVVGIMIPNESFRRGFIVAGFILFLALCGSCLWIRPHPIGLMLSLGFLCCVAISTYTGALFDILRRVIVRDSYVRRRDLAVILGYFIVCLFCFSFFFTGLQLDNERFLEIKNPTVLFIDILYFNTITLTTLGYGDITPVTAMAKLLVMIENLVFFFLFALGIGCVVRGIEGSQKPNTPDARDGQ
jgi:hypothetical protein